MPWLAVWEEGQIVVLTLLRTQSMCMEAGSMQAGDGCFLALHLVLGRGLQPTHSRPFHVSSLNWCLNEWGCI